MLRFGPYILKTLWRHRIRTALTMSGAAVALFVFSMVATVQNELDDLKERGDRTLIIFQSNKFCPATSHLHQDYEKRIAKLPGVADVLPILVFTNNCRASLDVIVFYGVPSKRLRSFRDFSLIEGSWDDYERYQDAGIVGQSVAHRRNLKVGQRFSMGGVTVTIAGIFSSQDRAEENYIYAHLDFLQRRRSQDYAGMVTQFEVKLAESADPEQVASTIDEIYRGGPLATDTRTKGVFQASSLADLFELVELTHYLGYACIGLMIVLVATTSLMSVQDRIREHAVLQTIGFSPVRIFGMVLAESVIVSVVGGLLGIAAAMLLLGWSGLSLAAEAVVISFEPSLALAAAGVVLSIVIGLVAGVFPAIQAAAADIVSALRQT